MFTIKTITLLKSMLNCRKCYSYDDESKGQIFKIVSCTLLLILLLGLSFFFISGRIHHCTVVKFYHTYCYVDMYYMLEKYYILSNGYVGIVQCGRVNNCTGVPCKYDVKLNQDQYCIKHDNQSYMFLNEASVVIAGIIYTIIGILLTHDLWLIGNLMYYIITKKNYDSIN